MVSKLFLLGAANVLLGAYLTTTLASTESHEGAALVPRSAPAVARNAQIAVDNYKDRREVRIARLFEKVDDITTTPGPVQGKDTAFGRPRLVGVLAKLDQDPKLSMAILAFGPTGAGHHLKPGEEKDGWRLVAIRTSEVDVQDRGGQLLTLRLQAR